MGGFDGLTSRGFSAGWERCGRCRPRSGHDKQRTNVNVERRCEAVKQINGSAKLFALDIADRGSIDTGSTGQILLAHAFGGPNLAEIPSDTGATLHRSQATNLWCIKPSDISDIIIKLTDKHVRNGWPTGDHMRAIRPTAKWKAFPASLWLLLALAIAGAQPAMAQQQTEPTAFERSEGLWRFADGSCESPDSTIAIGSFTHSPEGNLLFEAGHPPQFGTLDARCDLSRPVEYKAATEMVADCSVEGERQIGRVLFEIHSEENIYLESPVATGVLQRCNAPGQSSFGEGVSDQPSVEQPAFQGGVNNSVNQVNQAAEPADNQQADPITPPVSPPTPVAPQALALPMSDAQFNAITGVYADFCEPGFADAHHRGDGATDPALYDQYHNVLLVRYRSSCVEYRAAQVAILLAYEEIEATRSQDFSNRAQTLTTHYGIAVGAYWYLEKLYQLGCGGDGSNGPTSTPDQMRALMREYVEQVSFADLQSVARGYSGGMLLAESSQQTFGTPCLADPYLFQVIAEKIPIPPSGSN